MALNDNSQLSILNSQFSILNSQFSILNSQFSTTSFLVATPWGRYKAAM